MKTAELTGALLDYWVARAEGLEVSAVGEVVEIRNKHENWIAYHPSQLWAHGGPIIERFDGHTWHYGRLIALIEGKEVPMIGETLLIAAMRAYVASKCGDDVPEIE